MLVDYTGRYRRNVIPAPPGCYLPRPEAQVVGYVRFAGAQGPLSNLGTQDKEFQTRVVFLRTVNCKLSTVDFFSYARSSCHSSHGAMASFRKKYSRARTASFVVMFHEAGYSSR